MSKRNRGPRDAEPLPVGLTPDQLLAAQAADPDAAVPNEPPPEVPQLTPPSIQQQMETFVDERPPITDTEAQADLDGVPRHPAEDGPLVISESSVALTPEANRKEVTERAIKHYSPKQLEAIETAGRALEMSGDLAAARDWRAIFRGVDVADLDGDALLRKVADALTAHGRADLIEFVQ